MSTIRPRVILATAHRVEKYGGTQLAPTLLEEMVAALNAGTVPMTWNHDPRHPIVATNLVAHVERGEDGVLRVVAEFDVDESAWAEIQQRVAEAGAPGWFSFVGVSPLTTLGVGLPSGIEIGAEDGEFAATDLIDAAEELSRFSEIKLGTLFQFSLLEEVARVIIEVGPGVVAVLSQELAGAALYDAIRHLLTRKRRPGKTMIDLRILDSRDERRIQAIVVTDDAEIAASAVREVFTSLDQLQGVVDFDLETREWRQHGTP